MLTCATLWLSLLPWLALTPTEPETVTPPARLTPILAPMLAPDDLLLLALLARVCADCSRMSRRAARSTPLVPRMVVLKKVGLSATYRRMASPEQTSRTFKTAWFAKAAKKASIADKELCEAIEEVRKGQADDLGGGVFKKRLNKNQHRSIILAKGGRWWIYQFLFAKKDQANIKESDLENFRRLAKGFGSLEETKIDGLVADGDLVEICNGDS